MFFSSLSEDFLRQVKFWVKTILGKQLSWNKRFQHHSKSWLRRSVRRLFLYRHDKKLAPLIFAHRPFFISFRLWELSRQIVECARKFEVLGAPDPWCKIWPDPWFINENCCPCKFNLNFNITICRSNVGSKVLEVVDYVNWFIFYEDRIGWRRRFWLLSLNVTWHVDWSYKTLISEIFFSEIP